MKYTVQKIDGFIKAFFPRNMWGKTCQTIVALLSTGCCCYGDLDLGKFHPLHEIYRHMEDLRG